MTVFIVALATILVMDFAEETLRYQRSARNYSERIQADFMLKSAINLSRVLLEVPKFEGIKEDWLGEPWALIAAAPSLPISGFIGEPRLMIVDESGKINLNAIASTASSSTNPFAGLSETPPTTPGEATGATPTQDDKPNFWKNAVNELFTNFGFRREQYAENEYRTLGNQGFEASDQVAVLNDWIDADSDSHHSAAFPGEGIESSADKAWFYNRPFRTLSDLLLVPGMTLDRLARIAPYVRVSRDSDSKVNVNTAAPEVLLALGFQESQVVEMVQERTNLPITTELLKNLVEGGGQLEKATGVTSREFSVYAQVKMPNVTRWARATVTVQGSFGGRTAVVTAVELL